MNFVQFAIKKYLPRPIKRKILAVKAIPGRRLRRRLAQGYHFLGGFKRVYFYHIRKTAGTSLNNAFFGVSGIDGNEVVATIYQTKRGWGAVGNYVFVVHNNYLAESGDYYYAHSHTPYHELELPPGTFTITCLRDPVNRVISHYRNLLHYRANNTGIVHMQAEGSWLGKSLGDFINNIPAEHLMRQIYMFSKSFNVDEAFEKITQLNFVMFTEDFSNGLVKLSKRLNLDLKLYHSKSTYNPVQVSEEEKERLREMLEPEYQLVQRVKEHIANIT